MAKYVYPAVFTPESMGFSVNFPDVKNCFTQGATLAEAIENAEDVLCSMLYEYEEQGAEINPATDIKAVKVEDAEFVTLVECDTVEYRRFYDNKSVKKTLTIPNWLNEMAQAQNINFSAVLQEALKQRLQIN